MCSSVLENNIKKADLEFILYKYRTNHPAWRAQNVRCETFWLQRQLSNKTPVSGEYEYEDNFLSLTRSNHINSRLMILPKFTTAVSTTYFDATAISDNNAIYL